MFRENFPYTNYHDLNLDWIIKTVKALNEKFDSAISAGIKFADPPEWNIGTPYDAFTIVFYGDSVYMSTQNVPAGIAIDNESYWNPVLDMTELYDMIDELREDVASTYEINDSVREILFCGDSYSTWHGQRLYNTFINLLPVDPTKCHNLAVSGASFSDVANNFLTQIMNYSGNRNVITDIVVAGGINDALPAYANYTTTYPDLSPLTSPMQSFISFAKLNYPNARVHIAYIGGCMATSEYYSTHPAKAQEMAMFAYTSYAPQLGYHVLKAYNTIHTSQDFYYSDKLHPNIAGCDAIATSLALSFMDIPVVDVRPIITKAVTNASGIGESINLPINFHIINDVCELTFTNGYFYITQGKQIGSTPAEIATMDGSDTVIKTDVSIPCTFILGNFDGNPNRIPVPGTLTFKNGKVYCNVLQYDNRSWKTFTASSGASVTITSVHACTTTFNVN